MGRYFSSTTSLLTSSNKASFKAITSTAVNGISDVQQWTVPSGISCATFEIWGGGGAGAPVCCCTCYSGSHGSGGSYSIKTIPVSSGQVFNIYVGQGGCANACWFNANACGCAGGKSYVTGTGLSNFCAEGGPGGYWCNSVIYNGAVNTSNSYGGDLNLNGRGPMLNVGCWTGCGAAGITGSSPFGGGYQFPSAVGAVITEACGVHGSFPGGGGSAKPQFAPGWCDCCAGCNGGGADGLVVITY